MLHTSPAALSSRTAISRACFHLSVSLHALCLSKQACTCCSFTPPDSGPIINSQWHFLSMGLAFSWIYWHLLLYLPPPPPYTTILLWLFRNPSIGLTPIPILPYATYPTSLQQDSVCFDKQRRGATARWRNPEHAEMSLHAAWISRRCCIARAGAYRYLKTIDS